MKFISKYSNNKSVTPAQFITEIICEHKAIKDKEDLHYKFWTNKKWASFYRDQIATANKLVKKYDPMAIVKALKDPKAKNIYSLRAPFLKDIIVEHQNIIETSNKILTQKLNRTENTKHKRQPQSKPNILSKLKEIDNDS